MRIGALADSGLVAKRIWVLRRSTAPAPAIPEEYGTPRTLADLASHRVVHYSSTFAGEAATFEYFDGSGYREKPMRAVVTVNNTEPPGCLLSRSGDLSRRRARAWPRASRPGWSKSCPIRP